MVEAISPKVGLSSPLMTRAGRTALWTYRFTSAELKRRSYDEIAGDSVLVRPLRLGAVAV